MRLWNPGRSEAHPGVSGLKSKSAFPIKQIAPFRESAFQLRPSNSHEECPDRGLRLRECKERMRRSGNKENRRLRMMRKRPPGVSERVRIGEPRICPAEVFVFRAHDVQHRNIVGDMRLVGDDVVVVFRGPGKENAAGFPAAFGSREARGGNAPLRSYPPRHSGPRSRALHQGAGRHSRVPESASHGRARSFRARRETNR